MALSLDDVQRIAHLARIEITPAEAAAVREKLDGIFELIDRMRAVDTDGHRADVARAGRRCCRCARTGSPRPIGASVYQRGRARGRRTDCTWCPKVIE